MNKRDQKIIYSNYSGVEKKAIELVNSEVSSIVCRDKGVYTIHTLTVEPDGCDIDKNAIAIGCFDDNKTIAKYVKKSEIPENGYLVRVFDNPDNANLKITIITALTPKNVFYAAVDYVDNYLPTAEKYLSNAIRSRQHIFDDKLPDYAHTSTPQNNTRSIFTWGHPINNYRQYIDNAARCRINQIIIWNDFLPINAKDVVDYAHEYEIELIWGFAWGWSTNCANIDLTNLEPLKKDVVERFKNDYMSIGDGIYFQSFTELSVEEIGGVLIAEAVVDFVNETAAEIYKIKPDARIQFGLHASSVKNRLQYFEAVDKRIEIIWEDCGSFPYSYFPQITSNEDYRQTLDFTNKLISLRDMGKTGLVYKGLMTLDWNNFAHQSGPYIMGMNSEQIIENDIDLLSPIWRNFTADWLSCGKYVYDFTKNLNKMGFTEINLNIAAQLACKIWFPFALLAEILWSTDEPYEKILERVLKRKNVVMP